MTIRNYRQLFLFLGVLILPSVVIGVLGWRLSRQEEELGATHLAKIRKWTAAEIGRALVTKLDRLRIREMANAHGHTSPSDPAVVAVGWIEGEELLWPWDAEPVTEDIGDEPAEFTSALNDAKRAEFREHRYSEAADLYRQTTLKAKGKGQLAEANVGLARSQAQAGQQQSAIATWRDLLKLPSSVLESNGLSYWSLAALSLAESGGGQEVLARVNDDLDSKGTRSLQLYRFGTILDKLERSTDPAIRQGVAAARARLAIRLSDLEVAQDLQKSFRKLQLTKINWPHFDKGTERWLVGRFQGVEAKPLVLVVRWDVILRSLESDWGALHRPVFRINENGQGDPLSEVLPNLRATFPEGVPDESPGQGSQRSFGALVFVAALLTFIGGYLLWRDVRRETHIAELRTQFVSSVSHELKTPLTSIRMFAELLQMRDSNDDQQVRFLDTIVSESERLTRLLNNVLDFSRMERNQRSYQLQPASLSDVVQAAVRTIQHPLTQQGFVLEVNVSENMPPISLDRDAMQQAILNLLTNAMKYSRDHREIGLRLFEDNGTALIQVSDRGIGIPEKDLPRIFEKFYRASTPENHEISGTGLGLALVAHIAEAHGGRVRVQSRLGEGSTFSICLPLRAGSVA